MKLKSQALLTTSLQCAAALAIVFQLDMSTTAKFVLGLTLLIFASISGSFASTFTLLFGSLSLITVAQIGLEQIFGLIKLPLGVHTALICLLSVIGLMVFREYFLSQRWQAWTAFIEFLSIALSVFLFRELSVSGGERYLAMLRPEDNIPWMGSSQRILTTNVITGFTHDGGGHALGHVLALVAQLQNLGSSDVDISRSFATVGITYQLMGIIGLLFMARISMQFVDSKTGIGVALATQILVFRFLFPLIINEGHLTLYLAICFSLATLWNLGNVSNLISPRQYLVLNTVCALLIGGSWWPLLPISLTTIVGVVLLSTKFRIDYITKYKVTGLILALFAGIALVMRSYGSLFTSVGITGFLNAGGSFTESQPLMTGLAIATLLLMYIAHKHEEISMPSSRKLIQCVFLSTVMGYGIFLSQATYFVGPTFSASNYSAGKLLYAAVVITIPFFVLNTVSVLKERFGANADISAIAILGICGSIFFANNLANLRVNTTTPVWSKTFISLANEYPNSLIVCNSDQDTEAFECTKTARYVMQNVIDPGGFRYQWESLQLFPSISTTLVDAYKQAIQTNPKTSVIIISLEPTLTVQEIDKPWMRSLPWNEFTIINGISGEVINKMPITN